MPDTELLPKSKPEAEPVRRLEVFTGSGRRRRWTAEQKAGIVAESCEAGDTVSAVARRHGLTAQQLFGWRRRAAAESAESRAAFAPVIVEGVRACMAASGGSHPPTRAAGSPVIEIVIGAATVRVLPGIDPVALTAVLRAVRA